MSTRIVPVAARAIPFSPPELTTDQKSKSTAAFRAKQWREKQKQQDPHFNEKEAARKQSEREEAERQKVLQETVSANPNPPFVMKDAPHGKGLLVTGGYDTRQIEIVDAAHRMDGARRVKPEGYGSKKIEQTPPENLPEEFEDSFAPKFPRTRDVRAMLNFIRAQVKLSPMMTCALCGEQVAAGLDFEAGFRHLHASHPVHFEEMMARVRNADTTKLCPNDHAGMAARHGNGAEKLYCGRCRKLLYKPRKPGKRSDRPVELPSAA